jgi:hypothetical protein
VNGDHSAGDSAGGSLDEPQAALDRTGQATVSKSDVEHVRREVMNVEDHAASEETREHGADDQEVRRGVDVDNVDSVSSMESQSLARRTHGEAEIFADELTGAGTSDVLDRQSRNANSVD